MPKPTQTQDAFLTWWVDWAQAHPNASADRGTSLRAAWRAGELREREVIARMLTPLFQRLTSEGRMSINEARAIPLGSDNGIVKA